MSAELGRGSNLAVVGHFWSNRMLVAVMLGVPFEEVFQRIDYKPENGSVFVLECALKSGDKLCVHAAGWLESGAAA